MKSLFWCYMVDVSVVKCNDYDIFNVKRSLKKSFDLIGGIGKFVKKDESVLLKCNLLASAKKERAVTTHPAFVEALIILLRESGIRKIAIGDSPGLESAEQVAKSVGLYEVCKKNKVEIIDLKTSGTKVSEKNRRIKRFTLAKELDNFDRIINLPKMKTHSLTVFTGAVKNLFGCVPGRVKAGFHVRLQHPLEFSDMLIDLYDTIKPDLSIMDAIVGMEGNGPYSGIPKKVGLILASENAIALDRIACSIFSLKNVPLFKAALSRGIKESVMDNIDIKGENLKDVSLKEVKHAKISIITKLPSFITKTFQKILFRYPSVNACNCISCGKCKKMCPADAIKIEPEEKTDKKVPHFDYRKCIRCYCCHEICPKEAIVLKKPLLLKIYYLFHRDD